MPLKRDSGWSTDWFSTGNINGHSPEFSEHIEDDIGTKNLALQAEVKGLRELVDLYRERLTDSDWRYQELMEQFKTMPKALPAGPALPMEPDEHPRPKRRWWSDFRRNVLR